MRLFKNLFMINRFFKLITFFITFYTTNNLYVLGLDKTPYLLKEKENAYNFEKVYFQNSIPYRKYDSIKSQLKVIFGYSPHEPEKSFYPDLSIINSSNSIRRLYKSKLDNMTIRKFTYIIKNESSTYSIENDSSFWINELEE